MEQVRKRKKQKLTGLYFVMPSLIGVAIFTLLPSLDVFIRSFQSAISREFVGLENYVEVFGNTAFKLATQNTIKFVSICIPLLLVLSLLIAVILNKFVEESQILRTAFLIPMAVPIASVVLIWNIVFHEQGVLSGVLDKFQIGSQDWMSTGFSFWILVFSYIWKNLGYNIILWLAGLNAISKEVYESARVDGAGEFTCFTKITLPCLKPTLYTVAVLSLLNSFKVFREAYLVAGDYPDKSMYLLQHLFNNWFREMSFGKMAAASVIMAIIIFILIMLLQRAWENQD
ncbi:carbohydrate ABC transporter permease [Clostridium celatum]|uniref:carbohydrate ABC transporter permease n=1 Tax=Clostridium celatum TaxID=36834 RepID=UPI00189A748F|nr:sugar ABC transporter permease [Clostridium celatum]MCE9656816.1 sugar ABC transporter permease [Clostridium celatum]MDU3722122.1 sugar ABC transporter permease [Clostridium celatum]MDY3359230.1 sugar ABC transporter permease [Clostridium celatum]